MRRKYKLLERETNGLCRGLCRIQALRDIPEIGLRAGDIGGYVKSEENLAQDGICWIFDNAIVKDNAQISCNAEISGRALVENNAQIFSNACVTGTAHVFGNAKVSSNAHISNEAKVGGHAKIEGRVRVRGNAWIFDEAHVYSFFEKDPMGYEIHGRAVIRTDAHIATKADFCVFQNFGELGGIFGAITFYKTREGMGCAHSEFTGTIEEFCKQVKVSMGDTKYAREYELACQLAKLHILGEAASA